MKILLVCNAGMSTSILVREMEKAAKEQQLELEVTAMGFTQAEKVLLEHSIITHINYFYGNFTLSGFLQTC